MPASDNVLPFVQRSGAAPKDLASQRTQLDVHRLLSRVWRVALSDREYVVLSFIIDQTVGWGRPSYLFTYRCFEHGTPVSAGVGKAPSKVREIIRELEKKGAIVTDPNKRDGLLITPNLEWKPMLPTPKRLAGRNRAPENGPAECPEPVGQTGRNRAPYIVEHLDEQVSGALRLAGAAGAMPIPETNLIPEAKPISVPVPSIQVGTRPARIENPPPAPAEECEVSEQGDFFVRGKNVVAAGTSVPARFQSAAALTKRNARLSMKNPGALFETWKEAWAEAYGDVPGAGCVAWTKQEAGMVKQGLIGRWAGKAPELHDFVEWACANWASIISEHFGWMKKREAPPALPTIRFLVNFRENFERAYARRSVDKALDALSGHERMIRKDMLKDGLTHEEAMVKLAERRARQQLREEIEQGKAEVAQQRRTASAERAGLDRERRELERRMAETLRIAREGNQAPAPVKAAREVSDEELAASVQLLAKMMAIDPNGE